MEARIPENAEDCEYLSAPVGNSHEGADGFTLCRLSQNSIINLTLRNPTIASGRVWSR